MKNILIIAKISMFKEQPSNNRLDFLRFLSSKTNIKIMNDEKNSTLKRWLVKTKKRINWEPEIIMYYFLSRNKMWTEISLNDFNKTANHIPRYMIFEDHHYYDIVIPLFKKYNFKKLIKPSLQLKSELIYRKENIDYGVWGFYFDTAKFKNYNTDGKYKYDLLLYGFINKVAYPLRFNYFQVVLYLMKFTNVRVKYIHHPGYYNGAIQNLPKNEELSKIISESRFTLVSSSIQRLVLKKYYEAAMSGSTIIGDIPPGSEKLLKNNIIELQFNSDFNQIFKVIKDACENKYLEIEKKSKIWGRELIKTMSFEGGYNDLNKLIELP